MDDLARWVGEQLDEDERIAQAGLKRATTTRRWSGGQWVEDTVQPPEWRRSVWDPARVLREIDAKRKLIARGGPFCTSGCDEPGNEPKSPDTNWTTPLEHHVDCAAYQAAQVLALPYADRPGFKEEWRP